MSTLRRGDDRPAPGAGRLSTRGPMTEAEAVALFRASPRRRRRGLFGMGVAAALLATVATTLIFGWFFDEPWPAALLRGACWLVLGGLLAWWLAASDDQAKTAAAVTGAVRGVLQQVDGHRITVRREDGTTLEWLVQSSPPQDAHVGQAVWLSSPAVRGEHILAVADTEGDAPEATTVWWPVDAAWTTGHG